MEDTPKYINVKLNNGNSLCMTTEDLQRQLHCKYDITEYNYHTVYPYSGFTPSTGILFGGGGGGGGGSGKLTTTGGTNAGGAGGICTMTNNAVTGGTGGNVWQIS